MSNLVRTTVYLDADAWADLHRFALRVSTAEDRRVTATELVRRAIDREIKEVLNNVYPEASES